MKILVASSERFAGCIIDSLIRMGHEIVGVISPFKGIYDRQHRGARFWFYQLRGWDILPLCRKRNIDFRVSRYLEDGSISAFIKSRSPELLVLFGWPTRVPDETLALFPFGGMNIHPSLLPGLRGADPLFHIVDRGHKACGITFHKVVAELDAGPIYHAVPIANSGHETYDGLYFKVIEGIYRNLPGAVQHMLNHPTGTPQIGEADTAIRFRRRNRILDPSRELNAIYARTRACFSHHSRLTLCGGRLIHFTGCQIKVTTNPLINKPATIQKAGLFSLDVVLGDRYVRLTGVRVHGVPWWLSPFYLARACRPGQQLAPAVEVRDMALKLDAL